MVFDLIACNGTKRTYYILNGESISPYDFSVTSNATTQYRKFGIKYSDNATVLTSDEANRPGTYYTYIPVPDINLDDCNTLCFVMSCERFNTATLSINILQNGSDYPDENLKRVIDISNDGKKMVYKIPLDNLLADEYSIYGITLTATYQYVLENLPTVKIYQIYAE